jgi:hypothetical protein
LKFHHIPTGQTVTVPNAVVGDTLAYTCLKNKVPLEAKCGGGVGQLESSTGDATGVLQYGKFGSNLTVDEGGCPNCAYCQVLMPLKHVGQVNWM